MQNFDMAQSSFLTFACFCQSFPEALRYNRETGLFEMASRAAEFVSTRIRSALYNRKSQLLAVDPSLLTKMPPIDNHYAVCVSSCQQNVCMEGQKSLYWIEELVPDIHSAWTESEECSGSKRKDSPFSFKVIVIMNTGKVLNPVETNVLMHLFCRQVSSHFYLHFLFTYEM